MYVFISRAQRLKSVSLNILTRITWELKILTKKNWSKAVSKRKKFRKSVKSMSAISRHQRLFCLRKPSVDQVTFVDRVQRRQRAVVHSWRWRGDVNLRAVTVQRWNNHPPVSINVLMNAALWRPGRLSVFLPRFLRLLRNENIYCNVDVDYKATRLLGLYCLC